MGDLFGLEMARERQRELLREAEERRHSRALRRARRQGEPRGRGGPEGLTGVEVRWGLAEDEPAVAELLELNGVPHWISFEERFLVAHKEGKVLGAVRYKTESKRLVLGLLVVDPWAGEERLAPELYRGAGELAREIGAREVVVSASRSDYPGRAGYRRRGRGWRLDLGPRPEAGGRHGPLHGPLRS
ncbi:MAG: hypothetical protein M3317_04435 [Actinomycetota bacterium]|nr:hypothetical protein [Actinomycetota bacterium]